MHGEGLRLHAREIWELLLIGSWQEVQTKSSLHWNGSLGSSATPTGLGLQQGRRTTRCFFEQKFSHRCSAFRKLTLPGRSGPSAPV